MKTKLSIILALSISTIAFAKIEPSVAVVAGSANHIFKLVYKSESTNKVQVTIFNSEREMVFIETINNVNSFSRPYNFSSLPEGEYTIEVKDNTGRKMEKVNYREGSVESIISVKKLNNARAKYMLTSVSNGINIITVSIFNADGVLLHNQTHLVDGNFGIIYNLVEEGDYTFVVSDKTGVAKTITY